MMTLKRLLQLSLVMTFCVILLGAYTRLADAGLGCPDWPGCYGQLAVPSNQADLAKANALFPELTVQADKAWLEMIHRYFAGTLGLLVFAITGTALAQKRGGRLLPITVSLVVIFQALLGMWTVTLKLMPIVVMGHLIGGFTLFSLLALFYWRVTQTKLNHQFKVGVGLRFLAFLTLAVVVLQIVLGGWTSSNYAALMCTELPICQGDWRQYLDVKNAFNLIQPARDTYEYGTLDYGARMTIHVTHRLGAMVTFAMVLLLIIRLLYQNSALYRQQALMLTILLFTQVALGVSNVSFGLPLAVAVAHNLVAALLLLNTLYINHIIWRTSSHSMKSVHHRSLGKEAFYE